jgi:hypothetical protein
MTLDDLTFPETPPTMTGAKGRRCSRHEWTEWHDVGPSGEDVYWARCRFCGKPKDEARARRGRTSNRAGKDAERAIAKDYRGRRTGQFGGPDDVVVGDLFVVQSKVGWFSERMWAELEKLPRAGGRIPTLIVSERHGHQGAKTRRLVIREYDDDVALHGPKP